jgi:Flp pilus assembly pilin Flp
MATSNKARFLDDRGSVTTEYAVLLGFVAVACALAVVALGAPLVQTFLAQEAWILLGVP